MYISIKRTWWTQYDITPELYQEIQAENPELMGKKLEELTLHELCVVASFLDTADEYSDETLMARLYEESKPEDKIIHEVE